MIPLADNNPTHTTPLLTYVFIAACIVMFLGQMFGPYGFEWSVQAMGLIPARLFGEASAVPGALTPVTTLFSSMFLHGGIMHIAGNMLYLWVFGDNIENDLGRGKYLMLYLLSGLGAAAAQIITGPMSTIPMIGASGAISGVMGAYIVLHPKQPITVLVPNMGVTRLPAMAVLGLWFGTQLLYGLMSNAGEGGVAFWAHVGGFVVGAGLAKLLASAPACPPRFWN